MRRLVAVGIAVAGLFAAAGAARAHEMGQTQVAVTFAGDGSYLIDISVDPDGLLTRLQVLSGAPVTAAPDRETRDRHLAALGPAFLTAVTVRFDNSVVRPAFEYLPASAADDLAQAPSLVRLSGVVAPGAADFRFANGLVRGSFALTVQVGESPARTVWMEGGRESAAIPIAEPAPPPTTGEAARRYFTLGLTHIVPKGLDHILFVLGLFLLSTRWRPLLTQVTAFTVAHSVTLGLTMYGVVSLPARAVEPLIALSIAYVAIENLITTELKSWRVALVFSFGLLHGMGFAGILMDLELPRQDVLTALLAFNAGVEAGQLAVVAAAFAAVAYWRNAASYRRLVVQPASMVIALTGVYWTVQRLL